MPDLDVESCQAFLFDMDGTLLTSRDAIERVWNVWSARWGLEAVAVSNFLHGRRATDAIDHFLPGLSAYDRAAEIEWVETREMEDIDGVIEIPGAAAFVGRLPAGAWAVVTSAARRLALCRLKAAGLPFPQILIAAEDVIKGKPDPTCYLRAAELMNRSISKCLIFEDAPAGIKAALASGGTVIKVGNDPASCGLAVFMSIPNYLDISTAVAAEIPQG